MIKIGILDYGLGNNMSICAAIEYLGYDYEFTDSEEILNQCTILILPGVGSFPKGIDNLKKKGLDIFLKNNVYEKNYWNLPWDAIIIFIYFELEFTKGLNLVQEKLSN